MKVHVSVLCSLPDSPKSLITLSLLLSSTKLYYMYMTTIRLYEAVYSMVWLLSDWYLGNEVYVASINGLVGFFVSSSSFGSVYTTLLYSCTH